MPQELSGSQKFWADISFQEARSIIKGESKKAGLTGYEDDELLNELFISLSKIDPQKVKNHRSYFKQTAKNIIAGLKNSISPALSFSELEEKKISWETETIQPLEKLTPPPSRPSPEIDDKLRAQIKILDDFTGSYKRLASLKEKITCGRREIKNLKLKYSRVIKKLGGPEKAEALAQRYSYLLAKDEIDEPGLDVDPQLLRQALKEQGIKTGLTEGEKKELFLMPAQLIKNYLSLPGVIRNRENNLKFLINLHSSGLAGWPCYVPEAFANSALDVRLFFRKGQPLPNFACWTGSLPLNPRKYLKLSPEILTARLLKNERRRGKYSDLNSIWILTKKLYNGKYYSKENLKKMINRPLSHRQKKIFESIKNLLTRQI